MTKLIRCDRCKRTEPQSVLIEAGTMLLCVIALQVEGRPALNSTKRPDLCEDCYDYVQDAVAAALAEPSGCYPAPQQTRVAPVPPPAPSGTRWDDALQSYVPA